MELVFILKDYQYVDVIDPEIVRTYIEEARQFQDVRLRSIKIT